MTLALTIVLIGVLTYAIRLSFILALGQVAIPMRLQRALRFVPAAVLSALIVPDLLVSHGALALSPSNARLVAGLLAILVAWRTHNVFLTVAVGMAALWLLTRLLGAG